MYTVDSLNQDTLSSPSRDCPDMLYAFWKHSSVHIPKSQLILVLQATLTLLWSEGYCHSLCVLIIFKGCMYNGVLQGQMTSTIVVMNIALILEGKRCAISLV